jgi:thiol-disulfide isomerase/thioredoxin
MVTELTEDILSEIIESNGKVVVQFSAGWCGNCRIMKPKFKKLSRDHEQITFVMIDAEKKSKVPTVGKG